MPYKLASEDEAILITSWEQFKNNFGDFQEGNRELAHAVYGFFNNGGTRCWVMRVATEEALNNDLVTALKKFEKKLMRLP